MLRQWEYRTRFAIDDDSLSLLHARAFAYPAEPPSVRVEPWAARLEQHSLSWVGAFDGDDLVGFINACWDGGRHAFLLDAVVDSAYRRQGIGATLVAKLIIEVRASGCDWLHVDYESELEKFYSSCGFSPTTAGILSLIPGTRADEA